ncbi:DUF4442 domain-containing protein [Sphingobacterium hotanense]|uniref:YiiD C-terminal domain-containing protein n=2 Tax=Sphingobacteriaceae TaxID=84566 RepID=A0ABT7NPK2_9SPHI|nr:DUF4442 domain-containing protein [Sphingobacterium hotanense]MDM1049084.1 YiiD C-terminal domain-containing protein [Sphingobacterium hotanense]
MRLSPKTMKWALRIYPPFFFQRIWVKNILDNYLGADLKIFKSIFNINSNNTIFGGTIFSAIDPFYPILLDQYFKHQGILRTVAWLKTAHIEYRKPGRTSMQFSIRLDEEVLKEALETIQTHGKVVKTFATHVYDKKGTLCAVAHNEIYIRNLDFDFDSYYKQKASQEANPIQQ